MTLRRPSLLRLPLLLPLLATVALASPGALAASDPAPTSNFPSVRLPAEAASPDAFGYGSVAALRATAPAAAASPAFPLIARAGGADASERNVVGRKFSPLWIALGGLLLATDKQTTRWLDPDLNKSHRRDGFAVSVSKAAEPQYLAIPFALLYFSNAKNRETAKATATAVADASILTYGLKLLAGRERPRESHGETRFHGPSTNHSSFPSGHSTVAWAAATVMGDRYPHAKGAFYALAALVSWSRINSSKHFLSDVVAGGAIGVMSGRRVLRNGHGLLGFSF